MILYKRSDTHIMGCYEPKRKIHETKTLKIQPKNATKTSLNTRCNLGRLVGNGNRKKTGVKQRSTMI
jgi:hypothetical protein